MMLGYHCDIGTQTRLLQEILSQSPVLAEILRETPALGLENYYVGAGCVCQTVWNFQNGLDWMYGISDVDLAYFDGDLSYEKEDAVIWRVKQKFSALPVALDVKNQARVHLWYRDHYGYDLPPYTSVEQAIGTWPTTATAVGVRLEGSGLTVCAPFGLNDLFGQIVRPSKTQITEETYQKKCEKWGLKWSTLTMIPW